MPVKLAFYVVKKQFCRYIIYAIVIGIVAEIFDKEKAGSLKARALIRKPSLIILKMQ